MYALGRSLIDHVKAQAGYPLSDSPIVMQELRQRSARYIALLERMTSNDPRARPTMEQALQEVRGM